MTLELLGMVNCRLYIKIKFTQVCSLRESNLPKQLIFYAKFAPVPVHKPSSVCVHTR